LIVGGAIDGIPPWNYCISIGPCSNKACGDYCLKEQFYLGGRCNANGECCCNG